MFHHVPVLFHEVLTELNIRPGGIYADGTVGGGGHGAGILELSAPTGIYFGVDQDEHALAAAKENLRKFGERVSLVKSNYYNLANLLNERFPDGVDGILLDIGVSSHQIDVPERGFSYMHDAPLDMRMDLSSQITAATIINNYKEEDLARIIKNYGEERWAVRIAQLIVEHRIRTPIIRTAQLVDIIERAIPKKMREKNTHIAKMTFQALRIETNNELGVLSDSIVKLVGSLKNGGRLAIITFHSLEDRIVKNAFKELALKCVCPPKQPICTCNKVQEAIIITRKPIVAGKEELSINKRAASAKLRVIERINRSE